MANLISTQERNETNEALRGGDNETNSGSAMTQASKKEIGEIFKSDCHPSPLLRI